MTGDELKMWRADVGLSRLSASKRLGCSRTAYCRWEDGLSTIPLYIALACAAVAFNLPPYRP